MASNNHSASSSFLALFDLVDLIKTFPPIHGFELFSKFVVPDASGEDYRTGWE